jgi:hypothetical protein
MDQVLVSAAKQLEKQLDSEIDRLENLTVDDIDAIREKRLKEMKQRQEKVVQWKANVSAKISIIHQNYFCTQSMIFHAGSRRVL